MRFDVITIFPEIFNGALKGGVIRRAIKKNQVEINIHNLRDYAKYSKDGRIDDYPYGGGPGMILKAEPILGAIREIKKENSQVILLAAQGILFDQKWAKKLSQCAHLIIICGHYGGVDERVKKAINWEFSIGNYVLSGGEFAALVMMDAIIRLLPGVVGNVLSLESDSFWTDNLLGYPQYTRPAVVEGEKVPDVLLSGDHKKIQQWRKEQAIKLTKLRRPDLLT